MFTNLEIIKKNNNNLNMEEYHKQFPLHIITRNNNIILCDIIFWPQTLVAIDLTISPHIRPNYFVPSSITHRTEPIIGADNTVFSTTTYRSNPIMCTCCEISSGIRRNIPRAGGISIGEMDTVSSFNIFFRSHINRPFYNTNDTYDTARPELDSINNLDFEQPINSELNNIDDLDFEQPFNSEFDNVDDNPTFNFVKNKKKIFDLEIDNFDSICTWMDTYDGYIFVFDTIYQNKISTGPGATRQVYHKICTEWLLEKSILVKTHPYFADINIDHSFWMSTENIKKFVIFLAMAIHSKYIISFHLPPLLLEIISKKKMTLRDLEFYIDKIDPEAYYYAKKINSNEFELLGTDFINHEEYYRSKIIQDISIEKRIIYESISRQFELFDAFNNFNILTIDKTLSGIYEITPDIVFSITLINDCGKDTMKFKKIWKNFLKTLNEKELRQLLITFGNTLSLNKQYSIIITDICNSDIHITTCFSVVNINKKLFENPEHLNNLKLYFKDNDIIDDGMRIDDYNYNDIIDDSDNSSDDY